MADEVVRYEVDGAIARVTMNRPEYGNAQNSAMTYALDDAFYRAAADDDVAVVVLAGAGKHFSGGHDIGPAGRAVVGPRGQARRGEPVRPRAGGLPGHVPAVAGAAQARDRTGARRVHRGRPHARLGV